MARRKKKEETYEFEPPEFDEVDFMRREVEGAKVAVVTVLWAVVGALVSFGILMGGLSWPTAFLGGILVAAGLYYLLPIIGVKISEMKRRDWAGHGVTYFFSWLAFWILLLNAPFGDFTNPTVHSWVVGTYDATANPGPDPGSVACTVPTSSSIALQRGNTSLLVVFRATDNVGISRLEVRVTGNVYTPEPVSGLSNMCLGRGQETYPSGSFALRIPIVNPPFFIQATAFDGSGHAGSSGLTVSFV